MSALPSLLLIIVMKCSLFFSVAVTTIILQDRDLTSCLLVFYCSKSKVFVEYVMLSGVNDGEVQAHEMGRLLSGRKVVSSLTSLFCIR